MFSEYHRQFFKVCIFVYTQSVQEILAKIFTLIRNLRTKHSSKIHESMSPFYLLSKLWAWKTNGIGVSSVTDHTYKLTTEPSLRMRGGLMRYAVIHFRKGHKPAGKLIEEINLNGPPAPSLLNPIPPTNH